MMEEGTWTLKPSLKELERKSNFGIGGIRASEIEPDKSDEYELGFKSEGY